MNHDIDRTAFEYGASEDEYALQESEYADSEQHVFDEAQEMELAAELLGVSDEAELDQFLGGLIQSAGQAIGKAVRSPVGQKLGGFLKTAAKKLLPTAGRAAGTMFGGPLGGIIGDKVGEAAGNLLGLELEGLSPEDQEYEVARRFVRFAGEAARQACRPAAGDAHVAARKAAAIAAEKHAPGLLRPATLVQSEVVPPTPKSASANGRWVRQGRTIVLYGL